MSVAINPLPGRKPNADHRILICEDDRLIAMGWAALLADGGYTVVGPAHSAEKALKMRATETVGGQIGLVVKAGRLLAASPMSLALNQHTGGSGA